MTKESFQYKKIVYHKIYSIPKNHLGASKVHVLPLGVAGRTQWPLFLALFLFLSFFFLRHILFSQKGLSLVREILHTALITQKCSSGKRFFLNLFFFQYRLFYLVFHYKIYFFVAMFSLLSLSLINQDSKQAQSGARCIF